LPNAKKIREIMMTLIGRLILGPVYTPHDLYRALRRKGAEDRNANGGLGKIIKNEDSLLKNAFAIEKQNKNVRQFFVKDIQQVYLLAHNFRDNKLPVRHQNDNKYAVCLALIFRTILDNKQEIQHALLLLRVINELVTLLSRKGRLEHIAMPSIEKESVLQCLEKTKQRCSPEEKKEERVEATSVSNTTPIHTPLTQTESKNFSSAHLSIEGEAIPAAISQPIAVIQNEPDTPLSVEIKIAHYLPNENRINVLLNNLDMAGKHISPIPLKKSAQRNYFVNEIQKNSWELSELTNLLEYMNKVQRGAVKQHPFTTIRTEQNCLMGQEGNTRTWQELVHALKQRLIEALKIEKSYFRLSREEYEHYYSLLESHTARFLTSGETKSLMDFKTLFSCQDDAEIVLNHADYGFVSIL
jgi:hypothetical protein